MTVRIIQGDCREVLKTLPDASVHACVTSPPYWGLRRYLPEGHPDSAMEIGNELTPDEYVETMVAVFREVRRVLRDDGTLWLNLGDAYAPTNRGVNAKPRGDASYRHYMQGAHMHADIRTDPERIRAIADAGIKHKDLLGLPWMVAFALRADGWWLRQDNIWAKRNCLSGGAWLYAKTAQSVGPMMLKDLARLVPGTVQLWNGSKWTRVVAWHHNEDPGDAIEIVLRSGERIGCTQNHIWPTSNRGEAVAADLQIGDRLVHCQIPETSKEAPWLNEDAFWFAGLYLAEGHNDKHSGAIVISGHIAETDRIDRLRRIVGHYGGSIAVHNVGGMSQVAVIYSPALTAVLRTLVAGNTACDKHLTASAWACSTASLRSVAEGYLHGDGAEDGNRIRLGFCRNYSLERDIRCLAARVGATITLRPNVSHNQSGPFPSFRGEWRWGRSGHLNEKDRGEIVGLRRSRARKFWDVTVEDEPHLFAFASGVLTHNCMPESVTDRTTRAHEYVFMLTKSARYFYDATAIEENGAVPAGTRAAKGSIERAEHANGRPPEYAVYSGKRNKRSVWWETTQPFAEAHFATMPPSIAETCILAGSSERGCCPGCGAPWMRVVERSEPDKETTRGRQTWAAETGQRDSIGGLPMRLSRTVCWRPTCACPAHVAVPCTILDPFAGAFTTCLVADRLQRDAIGIELSAEYIEMARKRLSQDAGMFADVSHA